MFAFAVFCLCFTTIWASPYSTDSKALRPFKQPKTWPLKFIGPRIINGQRAGEGQFPWQAALFIQDNEGSWFCGGSVISEEWILTAGHCVYGAVSGIALTGSLDPYGGDRSTISRFVPHNGYNENTVDNDIGLVQLQTPLNLGRNVAAINLASEQLATGEEITISGWGLTSDDSASISSVLNYVELVTISTEACDSYYGQGATRPGVVCGNSTSSQVKGTCSGDSGGPVVTDAASNPLHVGIVSYGSDQGCESGAPSAFTRTAYYRDWIESNTGV